jgi:hypothetical protein
VSRQRDLWVLLVMGTGWGREEREDGEGEVLPESGRHVRACTCCLEEIGMHLPLWRCWCFCHYYDNVWYHVKKGTEVERLKRNCKE